MGGYRGLVAVEVEVADAFGVRGRSCCGGWGVEGFDSLPEGSELVLGELYCWRFSKGGEFGYPLIIDRGVRRTPLMYKDDEGWKSGLVRFVVVLLLEAFNNNISVGMVCVEGVIQIC